MVLKHIVPAVGKSYTYQYLIIGHTRLRLGSLMEIDLLPIMIVIVAIWKGEKRHAI